MIKVPTRDQKSIDIPGSDLGDIIQDDMGGQNSLLVRDWLADRNVTLQDTLKAFGIKNLKATQVDRFLTNTGLRPLFSPVVEDGMRMGMELVAKNWRDFIATVVPIDQLSYTYYIFDNSAEENFRLKKIGQGAPIPTARVTISDQSYTLYKIGRGIEWTDESKTAPVSLASMWFQELGRRMGLDYWNVVVETLRDGYFGATGSNPDNPPTYGYGATLGWDNLIEAALTLEEDYGYNPNKIICNKNTAVTILTMEYGDSSPLFRGIMETGTYPTPIGQEIVISNALDNGQLLMVDTSAALMKLEKDAFSTEFDRNPKTQVEGSYGTEISAIVPLFKNARLWITNTG